MEELLNYLGNPHQGIKSVHIAGTKGKGSTAAMIASVLSASGYKTGLYTSPHLHSPRERIQIDGKPITPEELVLMTQKIIPALSKPSSYGFRTTFEVLTALSFLYFKERAVDYQVVEVGLGGRLDATNVIQPLVAVITSISLDHTEVLGATLDKIAKEKAGIIKPRGIVVSSPQPIEAQRVIQEVCRERGAKLIQVGEEITWRCLYVSKGGQSFEVKGLKGEYQLFLPLLGEHQLENAAAAIATLEQLNDPKITPQSIAKGLSKVSWEGRLQILQEKPLIIVDGAHNAYSAQRLREAILRHFPFQKLLLIMGASVDKDIAGMVRELSPLSPHVFVTTSKHPRAAPAEVLASEWERQGFKPCLSHSLPQAINQALSQAGEGDLVLATGSLFIAAEVIEYITGQRPE
jgi:dihydrofolate synthase/folylpolyglutamate synthase